MIKSYSVIFSGLNLPEDHFKSEMSKLGVQQEQIKRILEKAPVILKTGMSLWQAKKYSYAVIRAGGKVKIKAHGFNETGFMNDDGIGIEPLESFTMCRQCGYKQIKEATCVKCGFNLIDKGPNPV